MSPLQQNFNNSMPSNTEQHHKEIQCWIQFKAFEIDRCWTHYSSVFYNWILATHMITALTIINACITDLDWSVQCHQGIQTACNWCLSFVLVSLYHISKPVVLTKYFYEKKKIRISRADWANIFEKIFRTNIFGHIFLDNYFWTSIFTQIFLDKYFW